MLTKRVKRPGSACESCISTPPPFEWPTAASGAELVDSSTA